MKNPYTTIGGIISSIGTSLQGGGILLSLQQFNHNTNLSDTQLNVTWWVVLVGYILSIVGKSIVGAFAADSATVEKVVDKRIDEKDAEKSNNSNPLHR